MQQRYDWNEVIELKPQGYLELNNGKEVIHGPIQEITVDEMDFVHIRVKWAVKQELGEFGIPTGDGWDVHSNEPIEIGAFPNFVFTFVIEETPEKGPRVRFGGTNILYLNQVEGVDPSTVKGLEVVETAS